ncbi:MAG: prolipoprotein diacylglyceryl transferase family protein [Acidimicrobiia bacterium]
MEFTLLWAALTGVAGLWLGVRFWAGDDSDSLFDNLLLAAGVGLLGGRVTAMTAQGLNPVTNIGDLIIVRGGVSTVAATVFAIGALYLSTGRVISVLDRAAPAALLGLAGWHLGCLWRGACLGTASNLPWAWSEAGSGITRHPVEIYAAIGMAFGALLVSRLSRHPGMRSGTALGVAAAVRLGTEPFRLSIGGGPVAWYAVGVVLGLAVAAISAARHRSGT